MFACVYLGCIGSYFNTKNILAAKIISEVKRGKQGSNIIIILSIKKGCTWVITDKMSRVDTNEIPAICECGSI